MDEDAQKKADQVTNPSLPRRLAAIVYDAIVVVGLVLLVSGLIVIPLGTVVGQARWETLQHAVWAKSLLQLVNLLVIIGFHVGF